MDDNLSCSEKWIIVYLCITIITILTFTRDSGYCETLELQSDIHLIDTSYYPNAVKVGFLWPITLPMALTNRSRNDGHMCLYLSR